MGSSYLHEEHLIEETIHVTEENIYSNYSVIQEKGEFEIIMHLVAGALAPDTLCHECGTHSNEFPLVAGALAPDAATLLARLVVGVAGCALTLISLSLSVLLFWSEIFT